MKKRFRQRNVMRDANLYIFFVDEFPLTGSGKIQKFKLREKALEILKEKGLEAN